MKRLILSALVLSCVVALAQPAPGRLRGTLDKVDASALKVRDASGASQSLAIAPALVVTEVVPIDPASLQSGTFVGTTAVARPDGSLSAVEVHVFAEAARGTGEGHRPSDLQPGSSMTNATVTSLVSGRDDRTMTLRYKDGEKTIHVPNGVPIVTLKAGDRSLLVPGAKVIVTTQVVDGKATAMRVLIGRDGFAPPM